MPTGKEDVQEKHIFAAAIIFYKHYSACSLLKKNTYGKKYIYILLLLGDFVAPERVLKGGMGGSSPTAVY